MHKILLMAALLALLSGGAHAATKNLCSPTEQVYFSCEVGEKVISFCSSNSVDTLPYMDYRYGTLKKIELEHRGFAAPKFGFYRTEVLYASNSSKIIWFKNQDTNYLINLPMRGGPILEVRKDGKTLAEMACKGGWGGTAGDPETSSHFIEEKPGGSLLKTQKYWDQ